MPSKQSRTRTWSVATSPRNPYKLSDELGLLAEFEGRLWNKETQIAFARKLAEAEFFEGSVSKREPDFSARDRINRAPKTFGFVRLSRARPIKITPAGRELIQRRNLGDLFFRQLLKWHYPSPNHGDADYTEFFFIRPFLEILRLIRDIDGLSKTELALFGVSFVDYRQYDQVKQAVLHFRGEQAGISGYRNRKEFVAEQFGVRFRDLYAEDIASGRIATREARSTDASVTGFLRTKIGNAKDYADAALRYFRATGLFTVSTRQYRLHLLPERTAEVDEILATTPRDPAPYSDIEAFYTYLGDPAMPRLPSDRPRVLHERISVLYNSLPQRVQQASGLQLEQLRTVDSSILLKNHYQRLVTLAEQDAVREQQGSLAQTDVVNEILDLFQQIRAGEVPDRPLYFEWNVWRAMSMLDDGQIKNNFHLDRLGQPFSPAPGRGPDIECEYSGFHLAIEVTFAYGARQYDTEGEPVHRHVGTLQRRAREAGDDRPVFGLFIADRLYPSVITHFFVLHRVPTVEFRGPVSIVPLELNDFLEFVQSAQGRFPIRSSDILAFFRQAQRLALESEDEAQWHAAVSQLARNWLSSQRA